MVKRKSREFREIFKSLENKGYIEKLKGTGTDTKTADWVTDRIIEMMIIEKEMDFLNDERSQLIQELESYRKNNETITKLEREILDNDVKFRSLKVLRDSKWSMIDGLMRAKLTDIIETDGELLDNE